MENVGRPCNLRAAFFVLPRQGSGRQSRSINSLGPESKICNNAQMLLPMTLICRSWFNA